MSQSAGFVILKAQVVVVVGQGPDLVFVFTDLPSPFPPGGGSNDNLVLKFEALGTTGESYVKDNFGLADVEIEVINLLGKERK